MINRWNIPLFAILSLFSLLAAGCAGPKTKPISIPGTNTQSQNPFLDEIPADSPVVSTSLTRPDKSTVETWTKTINTALAKEDVAEDYGEAKQQLKKDFPEIYKLLDEKGILDNPSEYHRLGFAKRPFSAFYFIGAVPVFRLELTEGKTLRKLFEKLPSKVGIEKVASNKKTATYKYPIESFATALVRVEDDEIVLGVTPQDKKQAFLDYLLGKNGPSTTVAETSILPSIIREYDYLPKTITYYDFEKARKLFLDKKKNPTFSMQFASLAREHIPELSSSCRDEIKWMTDMVPRGLQGMTEYFDNVLATKAVLELEGKVVKDLRKMSAPTIEGDTTYAEKSLLSYSFSVKTPALIGQVQN